MGEFTTTTAGAQAAIWPDVIEDRAAGRKIHRRVETAITERARQVVDYSGRVALPIPEQGMLWVEETTTTAGALCSVCKAMTCLDTGKPCKAVEAALSDGEDQRRSVDAQPWGDVADLERAKYGQLVK